MAQLIEGHRILVTELNSLKDRITTESYEAAIKLLSDCLITGQLPNHLERTSNGIALRFHMPAIHLEIEVTINGFGFIQRRMFTKRVEGLLV